MEAMLAQKRRVRCPVGAGMFYPEDKAEMQKKLKSFGLSSRKPKAAGKFDYALDSGCKQRGLSGHAKAIIAPHGAWSYSGALAASAFSSAMGRNIKSVVILGPIHNNREKGLFLSNSHSFQTPIGNILVDEKMTEEFEFSGESFEINDIPHLGEHSIEILLPFVKFCFPNTPIVPILMGQPGAPYIYDLAQALKKVITPVFDETLIIVSSNLCSDDDEQNVMKAAGECIGLFAEKNAPALASAILDGRLNACGGALVVSLIESGLLDGTSCSLVSNLVSSASTEDSAPENNIVYYGGLAYF
ncbi:MAG: AmmeMemoRadiSam system protein B [Treponema sp.]|nr:AmmeMemoRadiSam system protein B [Treponema sp.]